MKTFTPGKWSINQYVLASIDDSTGHTIAYINKELISRDEFAANGNLIASAPDLAEVLDEILSVLSELDTSYTNQKIAERLGSLEEKAKSILVKFGGI